MVFFLILLALLLIIGNYVIFRSIAFRQGKYSVRLRHINCPVCGNLLHNIAIPKSVSQLFSSGISCTICNSKLDKWGNVKA